MSRYLNLTVNCLRVCVCVGGYLVFGHHVKAYVFVLWLVLAALCSWVFDADLYESLLSHAHVCVFSLFLTPMFVLLQDSVPMASPAFLLSLFVSIQVLPPIPPEPGYSTVHACLNKTHAHLHPVTHFVHISLSV